MRELPGFSFDLHMPSRIFLHFSALLQKELQHRGIQTFHEMSVAKHGSK